MKWKFYVYVYVSLFTFNKSDYLFDLRWASQYLSFSWTTTLSPASSNQRQCLPDRPLIQAHRLESLMLSFFQNLWQSLLDAILTSVEKRFLVPVTIAASDITSSDGRQMGFRPGFRLLKPNAFLRVRKEFLFPLSSIVF